MASNNNINSKMLICDDGLEERYDSNSVKSIGSVETSLGTFSVAELEKLIREKQELDLVINEKIVHMAEVQEQNAKLWKLVNKQRTTIFELQQDLDRALNKNEKYRALLGKSSQSSSPMNSRENSPAPKPKSTDPFSSPAGSRSNTNGILVSANTAETDPGSASSPVGLDSSTEYDNKASAPEFTRPINSGAVFTTSPGAGTTPIAPLSTQKRRPPPLILKPLSPVSSDANKSDNTNNISISRRVTSLTVGSNIRPEDVKKRLTSAGSTFATFRERHGVLNNDHNPLQEKREVQGDDDQHFHKESPLDSQKNHLLKKELHPSNLKRDNQVAIKEKFPNFERHQLSNISIVVSQALVGKVTPTLRYGKEDPVVILSVIDNETNNELWRIIKDYSQLLALDTICRSKITSDVVRLPRLPEKSIFSNQAPVYVDVRREQLSEIFSNFTKPEILGILKENLINFLTTNMIDMTPQITKYGFLSKRGKSFGGWKTRYFVHNGTFLDYFERPGGEHLGTITMFKAQIGRQDTADELNEVDDEKRYKHALMIRELKRRGLKDEWVIHILCAETDEERDSWIQSLIPFVNVPPPETSSISEGELGIPNKQPPWILEHQDDLSNSLNTVPDSVEETSANSVTILSPNNAVKSPMHSDVKSISSPMGGQKILEPEKWGAAESPSNGSLMEDEHPRNFEKRSSKIKQFFVFKGKQQSDKSSPIQNFNHTMNQQVLTPDSALYGAGVNVFGFDHSREPTVALDPYSLFGASLKHALELSKQTRDGHVVPSILVRSIDLLEAKHAAYEEGLFRLNGSNSAIENLKSQFNTYYDIDLVALDANIHAVSGLLKRYLRDIPNQIIPSPLEGELLQVMEIPDTAIRIKELSNKINYLPVESRDLLAVLCGFLNHVLENNHLNKMSIKNLCIVFSPTLHIPFNLFASFLFDYDAIFNGEEPDLTVVRPAIEVPSQLMT